MKKEDILKNLLNSLLEKNISKLEKRNNDEIKDIKLMKLFFTKQECIIQSYLDDIKRKELTRQKTAENLKPHKRNTRMYTPSNKKVVSKSKDKSNTKENKEKENFSNLNKSKIDGNYRPKNNIVKKPNNNIDRKNYKTPIRKMHSSQINSLSKIKKGKKGNIKNNEAKTPILTSNINNLENKSNIMNRKNRMELLESINRANKSFILNNKNNLNKSNNKIDNNNVSNDKIKNNRINTSNKKGIKIKIINKPKTNLFLEKFDKNKISNEDINKKLNFGEWLCSDDGRDKLISISKYLDKKTKYNLFSCNKNYIKFLYEYINDKYTEFKEKNKIIPHSDSIQEKINEIKEKCSESDLNIINEKFNLSIGTSKAIELLNNKDHLKFFSPENFDSFSDDIYLVYKIIFQLSKNNDIKNSETKKEFFEKMCKYVLENIKDDKIGDLFKDIVNNFEFSQENIFQIKNMIKGNENKLKPKYYSQICPTTGFIIFLVKDILEYLGLNQTKKGSPAIILANLEFLEKMKTKIPNYLKVLEKYIKI